MYDLEITNSFGGPYKTLEMVLLIVTINRGGRAGTGQQKDQLDSSPGALETNKALGI